MELHTPNIKYLHIGCDEVFQMGECSRCRKNGAGRDELFLNHVRAVADIIAKRWPNIRPIVWDDMFRHVARVDLLESGIGEKVDPMVWAYAEDVYRYFEGVFKFCGNP
jgi:hexosaminidase